MLKIYTIHNLCFLRVLVSKPMCETVKESSRAQLKQFREKAPDVLVITPSLVELTTTVADAKP